MRPAIVSSDSEDERPAAPPRRKGRDVTPLENAVDLPPRQRKSSAKQARTEKENLQAVQAQLAALQKKYNKQKQTKSTRKATTQDDEPESEEPMSADDGGISFSASASITPLGTLPLPEQRKKPVLRKSTKKTPGQPKIAPRAFLLLPEPTAEERVLNSQPSPPPSPLEDPNNPEDSSAAPPPPSSSPLCRSSPGPRSSSPTHSSSLSVSSGELTRPTADTASRKRPHLPDSTVPPPAKRSKPEAEEMKFREGFVLSVAGKPKASDYVPVGQAVIIRACADYSARVLAQKGFLPLARQATWAAEAFFGSCRVSKEHFALTARITTIITARGSQIRGKLVDATRSLFASHYGLQRSAVKKVIAANKVKVDRLLFKGSFHYKDPEKRQGYAENKILPAIRQLTIFHKKDSLGAIFPSYFDPLPLALIALEITTLKFCAQEWSTGSFIQASFREKDVGARYLVHLADAERWSDLNPAVVETLRRKWYRQVSQTLTTSTLSSMSTNIDQEQEDALRDELAGRTGDTDSEPELEDVVMFAE
ncbi:hypothetical protein DFH07DRAFT_956706 [Mycena maculata]|uniref:DUF6532 domain-containing protein n=1 Tax=Mycena maculata TaxID=230809 RepID=A0AAD7NJC2_9AGAR|nr:hypothetical protein DFH07DRAFT_956706 [Mycena maculata]